jgi:hypothetical protein
MTAPATILIWRDPREGDPCGAAGLLHWRQFTRRVGDDYYAPHGDPGQLGQLARTTVGDALRRNINVYVGWQAENPETTPAVEIEAAVRRLWPLTIFAPERSIDGDQWCMNCLGETATFGKGAIDRTIDDLLNMHFPLWKPGLQFQPRAVILRVDITAEQLGLIQPRKIAPDEVVASVACDPEVAAATARLDRATPETWRELVRARLAAQARAGIPEDERAPWYSGQVEEFLTPILMRMGKGDEPTILAQLRQSLRRTYVEHAEIVLRFMLETYPHGGTEKLLALASMKAAA